MEMKLMNNKKHYTAPFTYVSTMEMEGLLDIISLPRGTKSAPGGGDAKQNFFNDAIEEEETAGTYASLWENNN